MGARFPTPPLPRGCGCSSSRTSCRWSYCQDGTLSLTRCPLLPLTVVEAVEEVEGVEQCPLSRPDPTTRVRAAAAVPMTRTTQPRPAPPPRWRCKTDSSTRLPNSAPSRYTRATSVMPSASNFYTSTINSPRCRTRYPPEARCGSPTGWI